MKNSASAEFDSKSRSMNTGIQISIKNPSSDVPSIIDANIITVISLDILDTSLTQSASLDAKPPPTPGGTRRSPRKFSVSPISPTFAEKESAKILESVEDPTNPESASLNEPILAVKRILSKKTTVKRIVTKKRSSSNALIASIAPTLDGVSHKRSTSALKTAFPLASSPTLDDKEQETQEFTATSLDTEKPVITQQLLVSTDLTSQPEIAASEENLLGSSIEKSLNENRIPFLQGSRKNLSRSRPDIDDSKAEVDPACYDKTSLNVEVPVGRASISTLVSDKGGGASSNSEDAIVETTSENRLAYQSLISAYRPSSIAVSVGSISENNSPKNSPKTIPKFKIPSKSKSTISANGHLEDTQTIDRKPKSKMFSSESSTIPRNSKITDPKSTASLASKTINNNSSERISTSGSSKFPDPMSAFGSSNFPDPMSAVFHGSGSQMDHPSLALKRRSETKKRTSVWGGGGLKMKFKEGLVCEIKFNQPRAVVEIPHKKRIKIPHLTLMLRSQNCLRMSYRS
jgi:hypothetical protein